MHVQSDICIIGNGAIGKVAALGLAQAGYRVTLLSIPATTPATPAPASKWDVRVYALNHAAHDLLASLKVWDALDASRIAPVDAMDIRGDGERNAGHLAFDAYSARVGALAWIVEDANLNRALDTALRFTPNVRLAEGRATALQISDVNGTVKLDNGDANNAGDTLTASLIVGADGMHSWVRGQCDTGIDYRPYHQHAIVTHFKCEKPHRNVAYQWFTSTEGIIALLPLPGQRVSLVWSAPDALADTLLRKPLLQLAQRLSIYAGEKLGALRPAEPEEARAFPLAMLRAHAMTAPRIALIGDAAHVVHPLAGQGMNLGFGDVAALLKVMTESKERDLRHDCGTARILARYERARKEEVLLMQMATDGLERLFAVQFEPLRVLRNLGLNVVDKFPALKRRLTYHALGKR